MLALMFGDSGLHDSGGASATQSELDVALGQYSAEHPDDWEERYPSFLAALNAMREVGERTFARGLLDGDLERMASGRAVMRDSVQAAYEINDPDSIGWRMATSMAADD